MWKNPGNERDFWEDPSRPVFASVFLRPDDVSVLHISDHRCSKIMGGSWWPTDFSCDVF